MWIWKKGGAKMARQADGAMGNLRSLNSDTASFSSKACSSEQEAPRMVKLRAMKFYAILLSLAFTLSSHSDEPPGQWKSPDKEGRPWKHPGTGLSFPSILSDYRDRKSVV
jgi:hypothetical protein